MDETSLRMSEPPLTDPPLSAQEAVKTTVAQSEDGQVVSTTVAKTSSDDPNVPGILRSPTALWIGTLLCPVIIFLAGFNVAKFYDLWVNGWGGLLAVTLTILGVKASKDLISSAILKSKP
jgi:hypothetical protein